MEQVRFRQAFCGVLCVCRYDVSSTAVLFVAAVPKRIPRCREPGGAHITGIKKQKRLFKIFNQDKKTPTRM